VKKYKLKKDTTTVPLGFEIALERYLKRKQVADAFARHQQSNMFDCLGRRPK